MVTKDDFVKTLQLVKQNSTKRKFAQAVDIIVNLKDLDLKKPDEQLDAWIQLAHAKGKTVRVCAFVGPEMQANAKEACDTVITQDEFKKYEGNKKAIKGLAKKHDFFIAQANIMPDVAKYFGRVLGPRGKMPNPKAGCVVPPNANLKVLAEKLKKTVHMVAKVQMSAKCSVGKEDMDEAKLIENIMNVYTATRSALPLEDNNIKAIILKYSMGPPFKVGTAAAEKAAKKKAEKPVAPVVEEAKEAAPKPAAKKARKPKAEAAA